MADKGEKKQSPHYIPELDPKSNRNRPAVLENLLLWLEYSRLIGLIGSFVIAIAAWLNGWDDVFLVAVIICVSLLVSFITLLID